MSLRPRCRADLRFVEQVYRGEQSYIVKDPSTQKYFRFRPVEALVLQSFDGRNLSDIATGLAQEGYRLTAGALEAFARKLAGMGLLERSLAERTTLEIERLRAGRSRRRRRSLFRGEILRMRWSVGDPDRFLARTLPALRWCFTPTFLALSVVLFASYFIVLAATWPTFSATVKALYSLSSLTLGTFAIFWFVTVVVIGIHELGHAYTCKYFGGEVHEMGFMLVYFEPAFYCNVNDAWTFPELRARLWVTAAGSWVQFILASLAGLVWWAAVPGTLVSEVAVCAMLVGGLTTVLSNMNPLIPLDGYFALSDWLEIPNLRQRAFAHLAWAVRQYLLRLETAEPAATERERRVFLIYAGLAACYILSIFVFIAALVFGWASRALGVIGAVVAGLLILRLAWPSVAEWGRAVLLSWRAHRAAWTATPLRRGALAAGVIILLVLVAVPRWITVAGNFTAAAAQSIPLVAPDSGVIDQVLVREGLRVAAGAPLVRIQDLALEQERAVRARALDSLSAEEDRARARGASGDAEQMGSERAALSARLAEIDARLAALIVRARSDGEVVTPKPTRLIGRRVDSGDTLITVSDLDSLDVRLTLTGAGATLVQPGQAVSLISYAGVAHPGLVQVQSVSRAARTDPRSPGVEARVRVASGGPWRLGVTGEGSVRLRRSNLLGALWWSVRQRIRSDLLL